MNCPNKEYKLWRRLMLLYGYIGQSHNEKISDDIERFLEINYPLLHKTKTKNATLYEENKDENKHNLLQATKIKHFNSYKEMPTLFILDSVWHKIKTSAIITNNNLWLFRSSTITQMFICDARETLNQVWFFSKLTPWKELCEITNTLKNIYIMPDHRIYKITNNYNDWKIKKIRTLD